MYRTPCQVLALLLCSLVPLSGQASTSASELGLTDAVWAALERNSVEATPAPFSSSAWLAALPSLEISYLHSEERLGSDETELGLNLPLKSPYLREQDAILRSLDEKLSAADAEQRRLFFSGLVREAAWSARIAEVRLAQAEQRNQLLQQLHQREEALLEARSTNRYGLLLLRQELVDAQLQIADQRAELRRWLQQFRQLTGLASLPADLEEQAPDPSAAWHGHPMLRLLDIGWQQQQALIAASSERSTPWNLRLGAKKIEVASSDETQYGLAIEIPLGFLDWADEASRSDWREAARNYGRERDQLQTALEQRWQRLQLDAAHLRDRQALLEEAASISGELETQAEALGSQNELGREVWISRLIDSLERQSAAAINRLYIGQNLAMSRQAAGIPL
ncbi:hypothetical protein DWB85_06035 [Seongchinamella sediminis]|uniref:Outer membrane efflux protein n=1 Tax=Seongchinamella sediminis TaxID=2283635 RepID=A0A3L7E0U2_9GAMM|nr:hypothetical protein [Seongchinamella sediminis]RLQ22545.1 hypothetical protein DWB85_06035 [Seongchinamella sediminis]